MADISELLQSLAKAVEGQAVKEDDGTYTLRLIEDGEALAFVTVYADSIDDGPGKGSELLVARAAAGVLDESVETFLLDEAANTWFARAYLEEEHKESPVIIVEAALPLAGLSTDLAEHMILEVIDLAVRAQEYTLEEEGADEDEDDDFDDEDIEDDEDEEDEEDDA